MTETFDIAIIGGGIVGLATGLEIQSRLQDAKIIILEKEPAPARHQTGHNSGVIHAGVYYPPHSLKARFCREGVAATTSFCDNHNIPYTITGKLIVATDESETGRLGDLESRARANGIAIERLDAQEARALEPNINSVAALLSPSTGIVDYGDMATKMAAQFTQNGGTIIYDCRVKSGRETANSVEIDTNAGPYSAGKLVSAAGLHSDRIIRAFGLRPEYRVIPFRGEYFRIHNQPPDLVKHLIYPVPDPERPFLGVHLTRKLDGGFTVGPNAVLAAAREGYRFRDFNPRDLAGSLGYAGFWKMLAQNFTPAMDELRGSLSKKHYLTKVQRYCPQIGLDDIKPYRAGVRAQAVGRDGKIIDDFLFVDGRHSVHVGNAPSPAATAAFPIAKHITDRVLAQK